MMTTAILGYPGVGKTWAISEFLKYLCEKEGLPLESTTRRTGLVDYHRVNQIVIVGKYDGSKFQGTDRLSMAVAPHFVRFFAEASEITNWVIAEGDRINCMPFFKTAMFRGHLERIKCHAHPAQLIKQRAQREHTFTQAFYQTVATKVDKHTFDAVLTSSELLEALKTRSKEFLTPEYI